MDRRSFLIGGAALTAGLLNGCGAADPALRVLLLEGSVPAQILQLFERQVDDRKLTFSQRDELANLFEQLQTWKNPDAKGGFNIPGLSSGRSNSTPPADLITLGDFWLTAAIAQNLIQPLEIEQTAGWKLLPSQWQNLVRRDRQGQLTDSGEIWAAPYRFGTAVIAYRPENFKQLGWTPQNWDDLWRPELKGKVSLLDSPRVAIGLVLKKLGQSVNAENLEPIAELKPQLQALHEQVKFYSSEAYLQPLLLEDTWVAVGWSTEVLPLMQRDRRIAAIVPASGTILTADLWVHPAPAASDTNLLNRWIEFCWQPNIAPQLALLTDAASPVLPTDRAQLPPDLRDNPLLLPPAATLERSEFLLPLSAAAVKQYESLWLTVRQTG